MYKTILKKYFLLSTKVGQLFLFVTLIIVIISGTLYKDFYPVDEWRYVTITQDLEGNFLKLKYAGEDYFEKPPFYFWILYTFTKIFGVFHPVSFKLPNIIALLVFIVIFRYYLKNFVSNYVLFLIIFLSLPINIASIQLVRMDFLMNIFINLSILTILNHLFTENRYFSKTSFIVSGLFSAVAVLIKGPAGFFLPFFVIFVILLLEKQLKISYIFYFLLGFTPLLFLWFLAGYLFYGKTYIISYIMKETAGRIIHGKHHKESFLYYFLLFLPSILPYSLIFLSGLKEICKSKERIFLYWIIISLVVLSISRSKLLIYLSSLMLPICIIIYSILNKEIITTLEKQFLRITIIIFIALFILLLLLPASVVKNPYIASTLELTETKIVLLTLTFISLFIFGQNLNTTKFLWWWIITVSIISFFIYNRLNIHYDINKVVTVLKEECKNEIYVYKWKLLYYFKWKMGTEKVKFVSEISNQQKGCYITSKKIYEEDKLKGEYPKMLPFPRDGGIVILKAR